jgi:hypothetical protein
LQTVDPFAHICPSHRTPNSFPQLADRMGELMRKDYDWRAEIAKLPMPTLLLFADAVLTMTIMDSLS